MNNGSFFTDLSFFLGSGGGEGEERGNFCRGRDGVKWFGVFDYDIRRKL